MGETYLHVTSPEVYSKRFSEYVKQFHSEDSDDAKNDEKKQKGKAEEVNREVRGKRFTHPKRMSESGTLPPINVKDVSSPAFSNGFWTFRGSNKANNGSLMRSVGVERVTNNKESQPSPIRRKDTNSKLSKSVPMTTANDVNKSPDLLRLTPIFQKNKKQKTEKKSPSKTLENTPRLVPKNSGGRPTQEQKSKGHTNSKHKIVEEPLSIRRKIEQYKRYHEEQYLLKLQKLKQDSEIKIELSKRRPSPVKETKEPSKSRSLEKNPTKTEKDTATSGDEVDSGNESAFNLSAIIKSTVSRQKSAKTWKTWRDINDSYAYTDVNRYIVDNDLMTPEKAEWIKEWIMTVNREYFNNNLNPGPKEIE